MCAHMLGAAMRLGMGWIWEPVTFLRFPWLCSPFWMADPWDWILGEKG